MNLTALFKSFLTIVILLVGAGVKAQTATATWALTQNGNPAISGNVSANAIAKGSNIGSLSYSNNGVAADGWYQWLGQRQDNSHYEFSVVPATGQAMTIQNISLTHSAETSMTAAVYYAINNGSFTQMGSTFSVSGSAATTNLSASVNVPAGATFKIRVFAWHGNFFNTGADFRVRNVVISGSTCNVGSITSQPSAQVSACSGQPVTLSAGFNHAASVQWYKNGQAISGAISASYTIASVSASDKGQYHAVATDACGNSVQTQTSTVKVSIAPTLSVSAETASFCLGGQTALTAVANMPSGVVSRANNTSYNIPDNNSTGVQSVIAVPETCAMSSDISAVNVTINHTYNSDLDIYLISPDGGQITLAASKGGSGNNYNVTFATGGSPLPTTSGAVTGIRAPQQPFSNLSGNATGDWALKVVDKAWGDTGVITGWSISFNNTTCGSVTYTWSPAETLSATNIANPIAMPYETTDYVVTASANGCSVTASVTVNVTPQPVGGWISAQFASCMANRGTLMLEGYEGDVIAWEVSTDNFATAPTVITDPSTSRDFDEITQPTTFRAVIQNGECTAYSSVFTIVPGESTTWTAEGWSNGVPNANTAVIFEVDYAEEDNLRACTVVVTNNADVIIRSGYSIDIAGTLEIESGTFTVENNANLLQSSDVQNAHPITIYRNSSALKRLDYTLWSSPVMNQGLLDFSPLTNITPTIRFYRYNSNTNQYNSINPIQTAAFDAGKGYLIRMPDNHPNTATVWEGVFTGVPNNGEITVPLVDAGAGKRYNLVGNPYPSPIDMYAFADDNKDAITGSFYFWRKTNNAGSPSYCLWTEGTFNDNGEAQVFDPGTIIRTGQGFFVEGKPGATNVVFKNSQRVDDNANQFFRASVQKDRLWFNMTNTAGNFSQTVLVYTAEATPGVDKFDGRYINDGAIRLTTKIENVEYAINGRGSFEATDVVPMSYTVNTAGSFTITLANFDGLFTGDQPVYLRDNVLGVVHNIKASAYTFASDAGSFDNRFDVLYQNALSAPSHEMTAQVVVFKQGAEMVIEAGEQLAQVDAYDIQGRLIAQKKGIASNRTTLDCGSRNQVVILKILTQNGKTAVRKVGN